MTKNHWTDEFIEDIIETLRYYAHRDHYEESATLENRLGVRPPGVLNDGGFKARCMLKRLKPHYKEKK